MQDFVHEKLDVYKAALAFLETADRILEEVPRGRGHLGDQLDRAATSIVLNVAEGAGEFSPAEKMIGKWRCACANSSTVRGTACWLPTHDALSTERACHVPWSRLLSGIRSL